MSVGMALGLKLAGRPARVYCVLGDGEIQEGQVWEAAMSAPSVGAPDHHVDNLCVILDYNGIQLDDHVRRSSTSSPSWTSGIVRVAGDRDRRPRSRPDRQGPGPGGSRARQPTFIVAHTVKGKGVSFMEDNPEWHGKAPTPAEAGRAVREILGMPATGGEAPAWAVPILAELAAMEKK